jgi:hypothetical protein
MPADFAVEEVYQMTRQATTSDSTAAGKSRRVPVTTRKKALAKRSGSSKAATTPSRGKPRIDDSARQAMIAQAAYFRAERRGFTDGGELNDWLEAEREISRMLES